uniref:Long-chain-fatty-acid--CoA ligase n=1 Tax=Hadrurus spadix TaxID=141984 RepID=A0A1W7RAI0_9SCOR
MDYLQYVGGIIGATAIAGAASAAAVYYMNSPKPIVSPVDLNRQSIELPEENARVSGLCPDGKLVDFIHDDVTTMYELFRRGQRLSNGGPCLGWRPASDVPYKWLSYKEVLEKSANFASGLIHIGATPGQDTFIGIYSQNSVEWIVTEHACYHMSAIIVPLYDTLGTNACTFIINQAEIKTVVCDKEEKVKSLLSEAPATPILKQIIVIEEISEEIKAEAEKCQVQLYLFEEILELGKANPFEAVPPKTDDIATVCYTSGTTGNPKGVMLTHKNIVCDVNASVYQLGEFAPNSSDVMMSFLPLAHMLERLCEATVYVAGGCVGFYQGDIRLLVSDYRTLRPTISPTVPRVLNRIYDKVQSGVSHSRIKRMLLNFALRRKQYEVERQIIRSNSTWDFVFKPIREGMGGRLRLLVSGSAPLAGNVLSFMRCALGCLVVEGYGQTECVAPCTLSLQGDHTADHVGPPIPCCKIKLVDVPDMEYYAADGKGEICIKGNNVFKGYLKDHTKTAEAIDKDGWLHTGDIGTWLPNGSLKIVDRKKHIFKLAQGEYIAPEKIENIYLSSKYVAQIFVHGESLKSCIVAVIVPDSEVIKDWAKDHNINENWNKMCDDKTLKKTIFDDIITLGKKAGLKSFEQVKDIYLHSELLSVDNGLLTPTLKTKRPECRKFFMPQIEEMYRVLV